MRDLGGHGVGRERWRSRSCRTRRRGSGPPIKPGMVFTIEPMINVGAKETQTSREDGWSHLHGGRQTLAQFEHSLAITETVRRSSTAL